MKKAATPLNCFHSFFWYLLPCFETSLCCYFFFISTLLRVNLHKAKFTKPKFKLIDFLCIYVYPLVITLWIKIYNISVTSESSLMHLKNHSSDFSHHKLVLSVLELHMEGIIQCILFWVRLLSLNTLCVFHSVVQSHGIYLPQFAYLFSCWWTFGLLPV